MMNVSILLRSTHQSWIDRLRTGEVSQGVQVLAVVAFALLTALGAQVRIYLWEVPFTLQTLAVYGSGLFLGWRNGFLAQLLYLTLGLFFPVFAGEGYGIAYLSGAVTAGYLLAYPLSAAVIGWLATRWNSLLGSTLAMVVGSLMLFSIGVVWLHYAAGHPDWWTSLERGWLRFIPVDLAKILCTGLVYSGMRRVL